jgi:Mg2+/Co2+ transporter CorB
MIAYLIFPNVYFANVIQPIIVGLILAFSAHMMEVLILKKGTFWLSTIVDFVAASFIVYIVSLFFVTASVTIAGALLTALLLTFTEVIQHSWLINSGRTQKSPT